MDIAGAPVIAVPLKPAEAAPLALDYSLDPAGSVTLDSLRPALVPLLLVAILSGLCVGSCFLAMINEPVWIALHVLIYAATLGLAVVGGVRMAHAGIAGGPRAVLDTSAGAALLVVAVAPAAMYWDRALGLTESVGGVILGAAFLLMSLTSYRHWLLYTLLARPCRDAGFRKTAKWMVFLGWAKAIYETIWLLCCSLPLLLFGKVFGNTGHSFEDSAIVLMFGAFFGCFGYALIWVLMIILHARALVLARRSPADAFEAAI